jgi:hypothetical protein
MRDQIYGFFRHMQRNWRWYVRVVMAWVLLGALVPAPPRALLGTPQTVETEHPMVCVHTRLVEEVEEWKIQRTLQLVREMGADTIVEFFPWAYVENVENQYDWSNIDRIVRHARNQGIHIIARMGLVPAWARSDTDEAFTTLNTLPEHSYDDFAEFVADFAARYAGVIDHIIIWNEPNLAFEWGYREVDPAGYVRLLQAVYTPAHVANPNVIILAAPLAPTLEPPRSPAGLNDLLYLQGVYEAGGADYFDALAMHTYGFTEPPDVPAAEDALNFRRAELLRDVMERYGDGDTPVFITETGWNDDPRWTKAVIPSLRIAYTIDALWLAEQEWGDWLDELCLWVFRYPVPTFNYPDNFTLVTSDFQLKPIYYAVQAYARGFPTSETLWLPPPGDPSSRP